jgi:hypothetical protein
LEHSDCPISGNPLSIDLFDYPLCINSILLLLLTILH